MARDTLSQTNLADTQDAVDAARAYVLDAMTMIQTLKLAAGSIIASSAATGADEVARQADTLRNMAQIIADRLDAAAAGLELQVAS